LTGGHDSAGAKALLRQGDFRHYAISTVVSTIGDYVGTIAIGVEFATRKGGAGGLGVLLAARALPFVVALPFAGVLADRLPRRTLLLCAHVVRGLAQAAAAALLLLSAGTTAVLAATQLVYGLGNAIARPTADALLPTVVTRHELQRATGIISVGESSAAVVGPAAGAGLVALLSPGLAIAIDAASFAAAASFIVLVGGGRTSPRTVREPALQEIRAGIREFRLRPWLTRCVVVVTAYTAAVMPAYVVLGPFVAEEVAGSAASWGIVMSGMAAGALLGGLIAMRLHPQRPLVAILAWSVLDAPLLALMALGAGLPALTVAAVLAGCSATVFDVIYESTIAAAVDDEVRGRVASIEWAAASAMSPAGFAVVGVLGSEIGIDATLVIALGVLAAGNLFAFASPSVRGLRRLTFGAELRGGDPSVTVEV
jgi:predicted MFS family arabinose efflux permease